jgi:hypothetical protein
MNGVPEQESLRKFKSTIESLEPSKQVAAAKWLEGVVVAQFLTTKEREDLVEAANEYVEKADEEKYVDAVNTLVEYLNLVERSSNTESKRSKR